MVIGRQNGDGEALKAKNEALNGHVKASKGDGDALEGIK